MMFRSSPYIRVLDQTQALGSGLPVVCIRPEPPDTRAKEHDGGDKPAFGIPAGRIHVGLEICGQLRFACLRINDGCWPKPGVERGNIDKNTAVPPDCVRRQRSRGEAVLAGTLDALFRAVRKRVANEIILRCGVVFNDEVTASRIDGYRMPRAKSLRCPPRCWNRINEAALGIENAFTIRRSSR